MTDPETRPFDIFVIGGGINGCGVARDAAGRGLSVCLAEMGDLARGTSSASTKLFHGGLRYLEYLEFGLVKKALRERETLLAAMPHISRPMRFVLPLRGDMRFESDTPVGRILSAAMPWMKGRRPRTLIRAGLFLYDRLGGAGLLPGTRTLDLSEDPAGAALKPKFREAYEYSDCWVDDGRLVALNARDAAERGADIRVRTRVVSAERRDGFWHVALAGPDGRMDVARARCLVNAAGPWVGDVLAGAVRAKPAGGVRLVRGSHIVTKKQFDHDRAYFLQGSDGRIIFAIPYEDEFTLIGTTDVDHGDLAAAPECSPEERDYLCAFASEYFERPVTADDVVWTFSGVRPLRDDGAKPAAAATRDYVLELDADGPPLLNVFGGKITTYRRLAEEVLAELAPFHPGMAGNWTAGAPLPGGGFEVGGVTRLARELISAHPFLDVRWASRLARAYGTEAAELLSGAARAEDLGVDFGATLTGREVDWLVTREFARTAEDIVWRRSKLGLRMTAEQIAAVDAHIAERGIGI